MSNKEIIFYARKFRKVFVFRNGKNHGKDKKCFAEFMENSSPTNRKSSSK